MSRKVYRFFGGMLEAQERWLNRMAGQGYRLIRTGKLLYEFEACQPGQVCYRVEFIGQKSRAGARDYREFLTEMGCRTFYKNINLSLSAGKVRWRPWAEPGGRIATGSTTFNRELLIVEMEVGGQPTVLHTSWDDRAAYYAGLRAPWLFLTLTMGIAGILARSAVCGGFALAALIPALVYHRQVIRCRREGKLRE